MLATNNQMSHDVTLVIYKDIGVPPNRELQTQAYHKNSKEFLILATSPALTS